MELITAPLRYALHHHLQPHCLFTL